MNRRVILVLVCILALGLGLRLFQFARISHSPLTGDSPGYDSIAWNLVEGNGYKIGYGDTSHYTAIRGPSYVLFLATVYYLTHHSVQAAQIVQILLDVVTCFLIFRIGLLLFKRHDYALIGALIYAAYPKIWREAPGIITEPFVNLMFMLAIYGMLSFYRAGKRSGLIICGLAVALGALSKPVIGALPVLMMFASWKTLKTRKQELLLPVVCILLTCALSTPWWIRNANVFHKFVPTLTSGGVAFWGGTGPNHGILVTGLYGPEVPANVKRAVASLDEYHLDKWLYQEGKRVIKSNPKHYAVLVIRKAATLWFGPVLEAKHKGKFTAALNLLLMVLALYGLTAARPDRIAIRLLVWLIVCYTLVHVVYFCELRYALPVLAYMFAFSAAGVVSAYEAVLRRCRAGKAE